MNSIYLHEPEFIEYNTFPFWTTWQVILCLDSSLTPHLRWKLMVRKNDRFRVLRIAGYIGVSYSNMYGGLGMIL